MPSLLKQNLANTNGQAFSEDTTCPALYLLANYININKIHISQFIRIKNEYFLFEKIEIYYLVEYEISSYLIHTW